jgi:hypothetical protein
VIWTFQSPEPRIADEPSWLPRVHTNKRSRFNRDFTLAFPDGISPSQLLSDLTVLVLSGNLDGIQRSLTLLPFSSQIPSSARVFFNAHVFFNVVPPVLLRPNPQILHILPFLLLPSKTTIINTHSLLVQYLPTQISLNIKKFIFGTLFGILLGHIVCK